MSDTERSSRASTDGVWPSVATRMLLVVLCSCRPAPGNVAGGASAHPDTSGIAALHQLDISTTLADRADSLVQLWDPDAVRILPGSPVEVGRAKIYADDKHSEEKTGPGKTVCYRSAIQDIQMAGDWAFEWGYFSYKEKDGAPITGKVLRVMHRQPDGSWKFARLAGFLDTAGVSSGLSTPCT